VEARRIWLRLVVLDVVLLATLTVFVFFEGWLIQMNIRAEGVLAETLQTVMTGERVVFVVILLATGAVAVAGVVTAWSRDRSVWPYVALGLIFLIYAFTIISARPSADVRERALSVQPEDLSRTLR